MIYQFRWECSGIYHAVLEHQHQMIHSGGFTLEVKMCPEYSTFGLFLNREHGDDGEYLFATAQVDTSESTSC